jgi:2-(1,2-epoxy-1,2-dihydrophenyl)acetyl-CoA isomerase
MEGIPMTDPTGVARRFYSAMADGDGQALFDVLADDFVADVSAGMPHGVGGEHHGAANTINEVWARIDTLYDVDVAPSEYLPVDDRRVVVLGTYRGAARDGGSTVDAAFAHVITVHGEKMTALRQITDTARWSLPAQNREMSA